MQVADDQPLAPQDRARRPAVAVKDADALARDARGGVDDDLPWEMPGQSDIVVARYEFDREVLFQEPCEERKDDGAQRRRSAHDGMLGVAGDHDPVRRRRPRPSDHRGGDAIGGTFGRTPRSITGSPET